MPRLVPVLLLVVFPVPGGLCTCCARLVLAPVLVLQRVPSNRVVLVLVLPCTIVSQWWGYSCPPHRRPHLVPVAVTRGRQCPCRSCPVRGAGFLVWTLSWILGVRCTVYCPASCSRGRRRAAGSCPSGDGARRHLFCWRRRLAGSGTRVPVAVGLQLVFVCVPAAIDGARLRSSGFLQGQGRFCSANRGDVVIRGGGHSWPRSLGIVWCSFAATVAGRGAVVCADLQGRHVSS